MFSIDEIERNNAIQLLAEITHVLGIESDKKKPLVSKDFIAGMCLMGNLLLQDAPAFITTPNTLSAIQYAIAAARKYYPKEWDIHEKKYYRQ